VRVYFGDVPEARVLLLTEGALAAPAPAASDPTTVDVFVVTAAGVATKRDALTYE
jgi:hypothetical protein